MAQFDEFRKFVRRDVPLAMHTWFQLGGPAEFFAEPETEEELIALLKQSRKEHVPVHILGAGSNVLVSEEGISGVVIALTSPVFCPIRTELNFVTAGGGARLSQVITHSVTEGLSGIEGLIGIPGTVGGALRCNAGTSNGDLGQWVNHVRVVDFDGNVFELNRDDMTFGYRSSSLDGVVILSATFRLEKDDPIELSKRMQKLWIVRKTQQPTNRQASGFTFKNPRTGTNAGDLIEQAGLKGTRIGGAVICEQNANFIVVDPEGTSEDVLRLIQLVQEQVAGQSEIELEPAIEIW